MGFWDIAGAVLNAAEVPRKEKGGAYARLIFLGLIGRHMFYLDKTLRGVLYILSFATLMLGWFLYIPMAQYAGAGALIVFWVFDLFTLGRQVDKWNATHETGNLIMNRVGKAASHALSIPLKNAAGEYNGAVETYQQAIKGFNRKKSNVKKLLNNLQGARGNALSMVSRMQQILTTITVKGSDVRDVLEDMGDFSAEFNALVSSDSSIFKELAVVLDSSTKEMRTAFNAAGQSMQAIEGKAGAIVAVGQTALAAIGEFAKQQKEVQKLKQKREEALILRKEVETKTMQLEATEKRAAEILKVINAQTRAFNHVYDEFCANVFPEGFTGQKKDIKELTPEQRRMFDDLGHALAKVMIVIKQEIRGKTTADAGTHNEEE